MCICFRQSHHIISGETQPDDGWMNGVHQNLDIRRKQKTMGHTSPTFCSRNMLAFDHDPRSWSDQGVITLAYSHALCLSWIRCSPLKGPLCTLFSLKHQALQRVLIAPTPCQCGSKLLKSLLYNNVDI